MKKEIILNKIKPRYGHNMCNIDKNTILIFGGNNFKLFGKNKEFFSDLFLIKY